MYNFVMKKVMFTKRFQRTYQIEMFMGMEPRHIKYKK